MVPMQNGSLICNNKIPQRVQGNCCYMYEYVNF